MSIAAMPMVTSSSVIVKPAWTLIDRLDCQSHSVRTGLPPISMRTQCTQGRPTIPCEATSGAAAATGGCRFVHNQGGGMNCVTLCFLARAGCQGWADLPESYAAMRLCVCGLYDELARKTASG